MESSTSDGYLQYLANLREELIAIHNAIENACEDIAFDRSKSNWQIGRELQAIIDNYLPQAARFGLYVIEQHKNYQIPDGIELTQEMIKVASSCLVFDAYGLKIEMNDDRFIWTKKDYSWELAGADCNSCEYPLKHNVIKEFLILKGSNEKICGALCDIWDFIERAKTRSSGKSPRSAIRENLLLSILKINNEILPFNLEEYIKNQRKYW